VDQTGRMYRRLEEAVASEEESTPEQPEQPQPGPAMAMRAFKLEQVPSVGPESEAELDRLEGGLKAREVEGSLILPANFLETGKAEFFNNNPGDFISQGILRSSLNRAAREQRLIEAKVDVGTRQGLFKPVELQSVKNGETGEQRGSGSSFALVFAVGF